MPLRKSPVRTAASLAANRTNGQKTNEAGISFRFKADWREGPRSVKDSRLRRVDRRRRIGLAFWLQQARYWIPRGGSRRGA